jgi:hypothetical protein
LDSSKPDPRPRRGGRGWLGLARTAALIGINLRGDAIFDLTNVKLFPQPANKKAGAAMGMCVNVYVKVGLAFVEALDELRSHQ